MSDNNKISFKNEKEREQLLNQPLISFSTQFDSFLHPSIQNDGFIKIELDQQMLEDRDSFIEDREENIEELLSQITEIHDIMNDLNSLVIENQPIIETIESSIETTNINTEKGVEDLRKASKNQKKYRRNLCWTATGSLGILATIGGTLGILKKTGKLK